MRRNPRKAISSVVIAALSLWLALSLATTPAHAFPARGEESWSDTFDSTQGIKDFSQTKVAGETLEIGEPDPVDLGVPVPGESVVYAVLGTGLGESGNNVYCGTGEKGHLVEYNPDEVYQEGYGGPTHWGVSNSRGQPWGTSIETGADEELSVLSLTTDEVRYVYGGTGGTDPDGSLIRFEPYDGVGDPTQRAIADLGVAVAGGGDILALTHNGATSSVFGGTSSGYLFYYDGSFHNQGQPSGSDDDINALAVSGTTLFIGSQDGHLYTYTIGGPGGFSDQGQPSGSDDDINALAVSGTDLIIGSANRYLYAFVIGGPGGFTDQGTPANLGEQPINALSLGYDGKVYGGTGDGTGEGHLFRQSGFEDHGSPEASPVTGVTYCEKRVYLANQAGNLYTYTGPATFNLIGSPDGTAINDIDSIIGRVYLGMQNGKLFYYDDSAVPPIVDCGACPGTSGSINCLTVLGSTVYGGTESGHLFYYDGSFHFIGTCPGTSGAIKSLSNDGSTVYGGSADGDVFSYNGGFTDIGNPSGTDDVNALAVSTDLYAGMESGELFSWDGSA